jgi:hypothetical protein
MATIVIGKGPVFRHENGMVSFSEPPIVFNAEVEIQKTEAVNENVSFNHSFSFELEKSTN